MITPKESPFELVSDINHLITKLNHAIMFGDLDPVHLAHLDELATDARHGSKVLGNIANYSEKIYGERAVVRSNPRRGAHIER